MEKKESSMGIRLTTKTDKLSMIKYLKELLKQKDQRIAELEKDLEFTTKTANELIEIKHKLEQELAELKEKAIVPPVKIGDTIYVVPSKTNYEINIINRHSELNKVYEYIVSEIRYNKYGYSVVCELDNIPFYFNYEKAKKWCCEHFDTEKFYGETWFATEQEAQEKLKETQGNE